MTMKTALAVLLGAGMIATLPGIAGAGATIAQKCENAKLKASSKKEAGRVTCYSKAASKNIPVDQACLDKATAAFAKAFPKADAKGACEGTVDSVEFSIDHCSDVVSQLLTGAASARRTS